MTLLVYNKHRHFCLLFYCLFLGKKRIGTRLTLQSHCDYKGLGSQKLFVSNCYLPTEIVFLKTTVSAYGPYHLGSYDVKFDILEGNMHDAFDIIKRVENGFYVGKCSAFFLRYFVFCQVSMNPSNANGNSTMEALTSSLYHPTATDWKLHFFLTKFVVFLTSFLILKYIYVFFFFKSNSHVETEKSHKNRQKKKTLQRKFLDLLI